MQRQFYNVYLTYIPSYQLVCELDFYWVCLVPSSILALPRKANIEHGIEQTQYKYRLMHVFGSGIPIIQNFELWMSIMCK